MEKAALRTVATYAVDEFIEKKSRFIAHIAPAADEECARAFVDHMVAKGEIDYSHIGLAYSVGLSKELRDDMEVYAHDLGFKDVTWTQVGGVISSHCGPTAFGAVLTLKA